MKLAAERYFRILQELAFAGDSEDIEVHLSEAFELGRSLVGQMVPPDEMIRIHHDSVARLFQSNPGLSFEQVADRLTKSLLEASMAYGLVFREHADRQFQMMLDNRVEQSQKLEAVGTLAAGIAHDFNNLLGSIIGFAEMAADDLPEDSLRKRNILQILTASFRARDLVARMLTFARQNPATAVPVDVVAHVRESLALVGVSYKPDLRIHFQSSLEQATVLADPGQIQQIVMNLCINAADAMDHKGDVFVRLDPAPLDGSSLAPGKDGICLTVLDGGHGMTPEVRERIFDPFFTTKAPNQGSGLGLSVIHGIVTQLGGVIEVQSHAAGSRRGTEFRVCLPLIDDECGHGTGA